MNPNKTTEIGMNKTGMQISPKMSQEMAEESKKSPNACATYSEHVRELRAIDEMEKEYIQNVGSIGSVPIPGKLKGIVQKGTENITDEHVVEMFIDKLGERLAFERTGVRIYDAFIRKCQVTHESDLATIIPIDKFIQFRNEELEHFKMLHECMESLGADPSSQTPFADTTAVMSAGILQVLTDPRTSIPQCTQAVLLAELGDHEGWEMLIKMAEEMGQTSMGEKFWQALKQESMHLKEIRNFCEHFTFSKLKNYK